MDQLEPTHTSQEPQPTLPVQKNRNLKVGVLILVAILIASAVYGGYWWWQGRDEAKDWQTYRNEEYGFEFKYPSSWKVDQFNS